MRRCTSSKDHQLREVIGQAARSHKLVDVQRRPASAGETQFASAPSAVGSSASRTAIADRPSPIDLRPRIEACRKKIASSAYGQSALRGWSRVYRSSIKPRRCKQIAKLKESKARAESHRHHNRRGEHRLRVRPEARRWIEAVNVFKRVGGMV